MVLQNENQLVDVRLLLVLGDCIPAKGATREAALIGPLPYLQLSVGLDWSGVSAQGLRPL